MNNPARTAAAFILSNDRRVLLIHENYGRRRYGPPGGLVEHGESPKEAVAREVREETMLEVMVQHFIGVYFFVAVPEPFLAFAFRGAIASGEPEIPPTGEIAAVDWFDPASLPGTLKLLAPRAVPDLLAGRRNLLRNTHAKQVAVT